MVDRRGPQTKKNSVYAVGVAWKPMAARGERPPGSARAVAVVRRPASLVQLPRRSSWLLSLCGAARRR